MNFRERYKFDPAKDLLGKGGFSKVYKATDVVRKREVALKFYYGQWSERYDMIGEINRMEELIHPNIIRYYDATIVETIGAAGERERIQVGIMEYANAGDITLLFKKASKEQLRNIISDILKGLKFLHENDVAHRDMKPKNLLLHKDGDRLMAKIADFGISKRLGFDDNSASTQLLGSVEYMAPEQFDPKKYGQNGEITTNIDLWSIGIIIYELFTQSTPFGNRSTGLSNEQILNNILFKDIVIEYGKLEEPFRSMVARCLVKDSNKRVKDAGELLQMLEGEIQVSESEKVDPNATQVLTQTPLNRELDEPITRLKHTEVMPKRKVEKKEEAAPLYYFDDSASANTPAPPVSIPEPEPTGIVEKSKKKFLSFLRGGSAGVGSVSDVNSGKQMFRERRFVESYALLSRNMGTQAFDTEAKFYLGFMIFNGKCGGTHDFKYGKDLMEEAKIEDRDLVSDLILRYVLKDY